MVKRIYDLAMAGLGSTRIARVLENEKILTTRSYYACKKGKPLPESPYAWHESSIEGILDRMEYNGCTCNFKSYSKSYKLKKRIPNAEEGMCIVQDTQEAIVPMEQWKRVQELRKNKRRNTKAAAGHTTAAMTLKHYVKGRSERTNTAAPIALAYGLEN